MYMVAGWARRRWLWIAVTSIPPSARTSMTGFSSASVSTRSPMTIASSSPPRVEGQPGAERQGRPDRDAVERDREVRARQAEPADAARLLGRLPAEDLLGPLPVGLRPGGRGERQGDSPCEERGAHAYLSRGCSVA
jgi:hypothetical protein